MTHKKWLLALGVSASISGTVLYAQNDLEALLQDLGGDAAKPAETVKAVEKAPAEAVEQVAQEVKPVVEAAKEKAAETVADADKALDDLVAPAAPVAEVKAPEAPAQEEKVAEAVEQAVAETKATVEDAAKKVDEAAADADKALDALAAPVAAAPEVKAPEAPAAETPAAPAVAEKVEEVAAPVAEVKAPVAEETVNAPETPAVEVAAPAPIVEKAETAVAPVVEQVAENAKEAAPVAEAAPVDDNDALVSELNALEEIRRKSLDDHGTAAILAARQAYKEGNYAEAIGKYDEALRFLIDRPANKTLRDEAYKGLSECYYKQALVEQRRGDKEKALENARIALNSEVPHPRAQRLIDELERQEEIVSVTDNSKIKHRVNEEEHKAQREEIRKRLRRSRQFLATGELTKALEQCDLILRDYPDTREAMDLRQRIGSKMQDQSDVEFEATRRMMIREVRDTWNTKNYAINSAEAPQGKLEMTTKRQAGEISSGRTSEQIVQGKLENIVLPEVSFRPPATIVDAVTFFNQAARDYDDPKLPVEQRGVNMVLKLPQSGGAAAAAPAADAADDPFAASAGGSSGGAPLIPALSARFINLKNALKLVCDVTGMKYLIRGNVVMIVPVNEPDTELITRSYNVLASLTDRISSAQSEMSSSNKGGDNTLMGTDDMSQKQDWKAFFAELGVQWPEGSSIAYVSTIGKLRVKNTAENLAVFEQVLEDLNVTPRLIEIEARFVEVAQSDLNSLGFEWLLNSDFSFGIGGLLGKNLRKYTSYTDANGNTTYAPYKSPGRLYPAAVDATGTGAERVINGYVWNDGTYHVAGTGNSVITADGTTLSTLGTDGTALSGGIAGAAINGAPIGSVLPSLATRSYGNVYSYNHNGSITAVDGQTYSTGMRYLSTDSNHIMGEGNSLNDQFMKVNAFLGNADLSMILHMLSQRSDTDLLNAPRVVTKNGQEAVMKVVTEYIYPTEYDVEISQNGSSSSTSGNSADPIATVEPQNFEMREVGTILQVVPEVSPEGQMINLMLNPQVVSEPTWKNYGTSLPKTIYRPATVAELAMNPTQTYIAETGYIQLPMEQPFFSVRSVSTQLSVYNGATVVIGGLITESRKTMEDKIPILGDIPYLGRLFRSRSEQSDKRNLLIFITAKLVDPSGKLIKQGEGESALMNAGGDVGGSAAAEVPAE